MLFNVERAVYTSDICIFDNLEKDVGGKKAVCICVRGMKRPANGPEMYVRDLTLGHCSDCKALYSIINPITG